MDTGVRAWPGSLGLRHCPDTYGWLQSRIFGNGRKLTERRRVRDEGLRVVNRCQLGGRRCEEQRLTDLPEEGRAKFVQQPRLRRTVERYSVLLGLKSS